MAGFSYLTASRSMHVMVERRWRHWLLMLFLTWCRCALWMAWLHHLWLIQPLGGRVSGDAQPSGRFAHGYVRT
jgi:hypothetical protein